MNRQLLHLGLLPASVAVLVAGIWLIGRLGIRYGWSAELQRKAVHVATGLFAMALPWLLPDALLFYGLLALAILAMLVLRLPQIANGDVGKALHGVERKSWGDIMLVAAIGTLYFFSGQAGTPVLYLLPLAVLTLSDAAAAVAGSSYGRLHYTIEDGQKSLEGSAIFFLITLILAMIFLLLLSDVSRGGVILLAMMTAAFATVVEADSWRGFDNYFVPVGVLLLLNAHLDSPPWLLAALAFGFLIVFSLIRAYGGALLGLSRHTARAYTAGLFMIGAVTALPNMVMPALALIAQTFARKNNPSTARHPDLDMLAMIAVLSFATLIGGMALGRSAISFYAIACGAITVQCALLAFVGHALWQKLVLGTVLVGALVLGVAALITLNPLASQWHGPMVPVILVAILLPAGLSGAWPGYYHEARYAKIGIIAVLIPLAAYAFLITTQEGLALWPMTNLRS